MRSSLKTLVGPAVIVWLFVVFLGLITGSQEGVDSSLAEEEVTFERIERLAEACVSYYRFVALWPSNLASVLAVVPVKDTNIFIDGWGREIVFMTHTNATNALWLESYGTDGMPGGIGSNADVVMRLP